MLPYLFGQAISQSFQAKMISHTLQQIHRLTSFFSIRMNVKLFHISADGGGTLATQGKMLHIFTFLYLTYEIRYLCRNFMSN